MQCSMTLCDISQCGSTAAIVQNKILANTAKSYPSHTGGNGFFDRRKAVATLRRPSANVTAADYNIIHSLHQITHTHTRTVYCYQNLGAIYNRQKYCNVSHTRLSIDTILPLKISSQLKDKMLTCKIYFCRLTATCSETHFKRIELRCKTT